MNVLHAVFSFPPDPPGGTELYVAGLAASLRPLGVRSIVTAPAPASSSYFHDGLEVHRFGVTSERVTLSDLYGGSDRTAAAAFERILDTVRPDLLHQHALTHACSIELVRAAKRRGIPTLFTYHTPTTTCQRGSLLEDGREACDGRMVASRCAACTLQQHEVGMLARRVLSATPELGSRVLERLGVEGGAWTALRMKGLVARRHQLVRQFLAELDRIVALAPWVRAVLQANGVPGSKVVDIPHGVGQSGVVQARRADGQSSLRLIHLGRLDPLKGTAILLRAIRSIPDARLELDVYPVIQGNSGAPLDQMRAIAVGDPRIRFVEAVAHGQVAQVLAQYDLVVVPSQGMETGPLVVLEAFAAGVPVIGSSLGGIADKIRHGIDGLLVEPFNAEAAWASALNRVAADRPFVVELARHVRKPRSIADAAQATLSLYQELAGPVPRLAMAR